MSFYNPECTNTRNALKRTPFPVGNANVDDITYGNDYGNVARNSQQQPLQQYFSHNLNTQGDWPGRSFIPVQSPGKNLSPDSDYKDSVLNLPPLECACYPDSQDDYSNYQEQSLSDSPQGPPSDGRFPRVVSFNRGGFSSGFDNYQEIYENMDDQPPCRRTFIEEESSVQSSMNREILLMNEQGQGQVNYPCRRQGLEEAHASMSGDNTQFAMPNSSGRQLDDFRVICPNKSAPPVSQSFDNPDLSLLNDSRRMDSYRSTNSYSGFQNSVPCNHPSPKAQANRSQFINRKASNTEQDELFGRSQPNNFSGLQQQNRPGFRSPGNESFPSGLPDCACSSNEQIEISNQPPQASPNRQQERPSFYLRNISRTSSVLVSNECTAPLSVLARNQQSRSPLRDQAKPGSAPPSGECRICGPASGQEKCPLTPDTTCPCTLPAGKTRQDKKKQLCKEACERLKGFKKELEHELHAMEEEELCEMNKSLKKWQKMRTKLMLNFLNVKLIKELDNSTKRCGTKAGTGDEPSPVPND